MKSFSKAAVIGSALLTTSSAFALDMPDMTGYYYSVQYALLEVDITKSSGTAVGSGAATTPGVVFELGRTVFPNEVANISVEGVLVLGLEDKTAYTFNSGNSKVEGGVDNAIGVQVKAHRQFNEQFAGYVNLGVMNVSANITEQVRGNNGVWVDRATNDEDQTSYTYSVGAEYRVGEAAAITFSYNSILSDDVGTSDVDITSFNLGYKASF